MPFGAQARQWSRQLVWANLQTYVFIWEFMWNCLYLKWQIVYDNNNSIIHNKYMHIIYEIFNTMCAHICFRYTLWDIEACMDCRPHHGIWSTVALIAYNTCYASSNRIRWHTHTHMWNLIQYITLAEGLTRIAMAHIRINWEFWPY